MGTFIILGKKRLLNYDSKIGCNIDIYVYCMYIKLHAH